MSLNKKMPDEAWLWAEKTRQSCGVWDAEFKHRFGVAFPGTKYHRADLDSERRRVLADLLEQTVKATHGFLALEETIAYLRGAAE